eukprot:Gb_07178 [translate_table: standard]
MKALEILNYLGTLEEDHNLINLGELMNDFPLDPQMYKMLVIILEFNFSNEILSIMVMLSVLNYFLRIWEDQKYVDEVKYYFLYIGDRLMLLNAYHAYKKNNEDMTW